MIRGVYVKIWTIGGDSAAAALSVVRLLTNVRFMKKIYQLLFLLVPILLFFGCGGEGGDFFDVLQPRPAVISDIENSLFLFTGFEFGAAFDPSLNSTETTIKFGSSADDNAPYKLPFAISTTGGESSGIAKFSGDKLILDFNQTSADHPFSVNEPIIFDILADVDDGRISLTNTMTGIEQTSAPE